MKEFLKDLDKAFENRIRLGIMSALMVNDQLDFNTLKDLLGVTDGNLASHLKSLEKSEYVSFSKSFLERNQTHPMLPQPKAKWHSEKHIGAIEKLLL